MKVMVPMLFLLALAACNTIEGIGKDFQAAGRAMTHSADEVKRP